MASVTGNTKTVNSVKYTPTFTVSLENNEPGMNRYRVKIEISAENTTSGTKSVNFSVTMKHNGPQYSSNPTSTTANISRSISGNTTVTITTGDKYLIVGKTTSTQTVTFTASNGTYFAASLTIDMSVAAKNKYTITYNTGGIGSNTSQSIYYAEETPNVSRTATGYTFNDWYTSNQYTILALLPKKIYGATTFYGNWIENSYTLKFNANGGESILPDVKLYYTQNYTLPDSGVGKAGYHLVGWNANAAGTSTSYTLGQTVSKLNSAVDGTKTLYAVWEANE